MQHPRPCHTRTVIFARNVPPVATAIARVSFPTQCCQKWEPEPQPLPRIFTSGSGARLRADHRPPACALFENPELVEGSPNFVRRELARVSATDLIVVGCSRRGPGCAVIPL